MLKSRGGCVGKRAYQENIEHGFYYKMMRRTLDVSDLPSHPPLDENGKPLSLVTDIS